MCLVGIDHQCLCHDKIFLAVRNGAVSWADLSVNNMSRPQLRTGWQSGPYGMTGSLGSVPPTPPASELDQITAFPPAPPATLSCAPIPCSQQSTCSPSQPCTPTPASSPPVFRPSLPTPASSPPVFRPSLPRSNAPPTPSNTTPGSTSDLRVYGFDLNESWQADREHCDSQKINGLTLPKTIRTSNFTAKLDIEGCDPLALPVAAFAALLYQQANNFWLRKLAHGRELYLIPTGDIASVVFATELLSQRETEALTWIGSRRSGPDRMGNIWTRRQTPNMRHRLMQSIFPLKATDPDSQHEIAQLRNQLAEPRQRLSDDGSPGAPDASTPTRPGQASSSSQASPIRGHCRMHLHPLLHLSIQHASCLFQFMPTIGSLIISLLASAIVRSTLGTKP